jgi:trehalose 6-phosphate phosphatase
VTVDALTIGLRRALAQLARTPRVLVACDYDGTLAPIVADPRRAAPIPESVTALRSLAAMPATTTAVISGRALRDLAVLSRLPAEVHLVGSHGSEFDVGFVHEITPAQKELHEKLLIELGALVDGRPEVYLEVKPASIAVHLRQANAEVAQEILTAVLDGPRRWPGVTTTEGKRAVELSTVGSDKGAALDALRHQVGATAAVFFGDDVTDERAFARLTGPDVGIKVGDGYSAAAHRILDTSVVAMALAFLVEQRRLWLFGEDAVPIERLSMLSNGQSVALLTPDARVTWMCHPEPDSAAVFADLLGGPPAGYFSIRPERNGLPLGQRYLPGTMTVETRWPQLLVTDYLVHLDEVNRTDLIRAVSGRSRAVVEFAPRPEFGQVTVRLERVPDGLRVLGTSDPWVLRAPGVDWEIATDGTLPTARATRSGRWGGPARTALRHRRPRAVADRGIRATPAGVGVVVGMAGDVAPARRPARAGGPLRIDPAGPVPQRDRGDPGCGHHVATRGDRRRTELGLPLLLVARRGDDRADAGGVGIRRRGGGVPVLVTPGP